MSRKNDKKCFKVVSVYGKTRESLYGWNSGERFTIVYDTTGKLVKPAKGQNPYIFVFSKLEDAKKYHTNCITEIYECKVNGFTKECPDGFSHCFPEGTCWCNSLRLTKKIL